MRNQNGDILNDDILIKRIVKGEKDLFNILIERHKKYAFTIALKVLNNREDAEEAAHDSFIKAYQNLNKFNREAKFSTWLYRIAFNTAITYKRKQKVKKEDLQIVKQTFHEKYSPALELEDQRKYIKKGLSKLTDIDKTVLTLFYLKEFSLEEVADITNLNVNNVKVRLHRSRKKMADEMKNILKEEVLNL